MKAKNVFLIMLVSLIAVTIVSYAQDVPKFVHYQGNLADASQKPVNGNVLMIFSLWSQKTGGTKVWEEVHSQVNVVQGLFSEILGRDTPFPADLFSSSSRYLQIQIGNEVLSPRQDLASVAYSLNAGNGIPVGTILDWWRPSGTSFQPPAGFEICDGHTVSDVQSPYVGKAVPDLRDKFIRGVASTFSIGATGGTTQHTHNFTGVTQPADVNTYTDADWCANCNRDKDLTRKEHKHNFSGTTATVDHLPPYYGLLKIIRVK